MATVEESLFATAKDKRGKRKNKMGEKWRMENVLRKEDIFFKRDSLSETSLGYSLSPNSFFSSSPLGEKTVS